MKTIRELQNEMEKLDLETRYISNKIDLKESYRGVKSFDADLVINELNRLATFHENLSIKNSGDSANGHFEAAKQVRDSVTYIIRTQRQRQC